MASGGKTRPSFGTLPKLDKAAPVSKDQAATAVKNVQKMSVGAVPKAGAWKTKSGSESGSGSRLREARKKAVGSSGKQDDELSRPSGTRASSTSRPSSSHKSEKSASSRPPSQHSEKSASSRPPSTQQSEKSAPRKTAPSSRTAAPRGAAAKPAAKRAAAKAAESDALEEDDVVYSWPPRPKVTAPPVETPPTDEPSELPSARGSERGEETSKAEAEPETKTTVFRPLFEAPAPPSPSAAKLSLQSGVDDITISKALAERRCRTALEIPFQIVQVMKDRPLFEHSSVSATVQRTVRMWVKGECSGELVALTLLNRPAFFLEDAAQKDAIKMLATTPLALCEQMCDESEILASALEVNFLKQESIPSPCNGLWREVVRQALGCKTFGFDYDTYREELSDCPPAATRERNDFIGRYIYELLQIKRELLKGSADTAYEVLGVKPEATDEQVRKAYRMLCLKHHPDKGGDPAVFLDVQRAYHTIQEMRKEERGETDEPKKDEEEEEKKEKDPHVEGNADGEGGEKAEKKEKKEEALKEKEPHWLCAKLSGVLEEVQKLKNAGMASVAAKQTIESLQSTYTLRAVQEATQAAQSAITDALVVVAEGLGEKVAKLVLDVGQGCMDLPDFDAATALVVEHGMQMMIKGQSLRDGSKNLKPIQKEISLSLDTLKANLTISNMLGTMDKDVAKMSLNLVAEAGRRAQTALKTVLQLSEALEVTITTAIMHAQGLGKEPTRPFSPDLEPMEPPPCDAEPKEEKKEAAPAGPELGDGGISRVESVGADQRKLMRRLLDDIEMIRRPLSKDGLVLAMRIICESIAVDFPLSAKDAFSVPNAALKAVLHHPEGRGRLSILIDEMKRTGMRVTEELESLVTAS